VTICSFENNEELNRCFAVVDWHDVGFSKEHAVEGQKCLRVTAPHRGGWLKAFLSGSKQLDLTPFEAIRFWVYNPGATRARLEFAIVSDNGVASRFPQTFVNPNSGRWVEAPTSLLQWQGLDVSRITKLTIGYSPQHARGQDSEDSVAFEQGNILFLDTLQMTGHTYPRDELVRSILQTPADYLEALTNRPLALIQETANKLVRSGTPEAAEILVRAMGSPHAAYACTDALMRMDRSAVLPAVTRALSAPNRNVRMLACAIIAHYRQAEDSSLLAQVLQDGDRYVRHFAAEALTDGPWNGCEAELLAALDDDYPLVRLNAAKALSRAKQNRAQVIAGLERHVSDPAAGINANRALHALRAVESVAVLCDALSNPNLAFEAAQALATLRPPEAVARVSQFLASCRERGHFSGRAVAAACQAAGNLACLESRTVLETLARESPDETVRYFAVQAIGRIGQTSDVVYAALDDPSPLVRMAATRALPSTSPRRFAELDLLLTNFDASIAHVAADLLGTNVPL